MKNQLIKEIIRVKKLVKTFAKQHNPQVFINRVNPLQRMINDLFFEFMLENASEFNKISYKQDDFNKFVDDCWKYCQGDKRVMI
jgi:hypothetical protein